MFDSMMNRKLSLFSLAALFFAVTSHAQDAKTSVPVAPRDSSMGKPWEQNSIDLETGYLWKVGGDTPLDYNMVPVMLSWRSKEVLGFHFENGSALVVRNRVTLLGQWVETGAENHYFGIMGAPSIEWWNPSATWSIYGNIGGGFGLIDSQGVTGGQGQDFTLNWYAASGIAFAVSDNMQIRAGAMFQHLSNGGATDPNPGINSLGVTLGVSWGF